MLIASYFESGDIILLTVELMGTCMNYIRLSYIVCEPSYFEMTHYYQVDVPRKDPHSMQQGTIKYLDGHTIQVN